MSLCGTLEFLDWESQFFNVRTAKLHIQSAAEPLTEAVVSTYELVQAKVDADDVTTIDALHSLGFQLAEGEIDVCLTLDGRAQTDIPLAQKAGGPDIAEISAAASAAFRLSRFRAPWYQPHDSARFYAMWAEKAVLGTFDHVCLQIKGPDGERRGFVTLRQTATGEARIGLLAVLPQWQGIGIGKQLMEAAQHWCAEHGLSRLQVATQTGNVAALNLYLASGGKVTRSAYWLYR